MRFGNCLFSSAIAVAFIGQSVFAASINVSTGLDSSNALITTGGTNDAHWIVGESTGGTGAAQVVESTNPDWFSEWAANGPNSAWIARSATNPYNGAGPYTFSTTFDLTGIDLSTVSLIGKWAIDDQGTLDLNGHQIGSLASHMWGSLTSFSDATAADFNQGVNTLSMTITTDDNYLEAVRLEGSVSGQAIVSAVPVPASVWSGLSLLAILGATIIVRRRSLAA